MAEVGGETFPVPPKRPTVIRPDTNGPALPARPAPPVPGGRPPPPVPSRLNADAAPVAPRRPSPAAARTTDVDVQLRPTSRPTKPPDRPTSVASGSVRKRPEITIVSARPMSEVGFRSDKSPDMHSSSSKTEKPPEVPGKPPPRSPRHVSPTPAQKVPSSSNNDNLLIDFESECIPSPSSAAAAVAAATNSLQPAPKPTNMRPPPPKPAPARGAPPVPKKAETDVLNPQENSNMLKTPPSPVKRPVPPPAPRTSVVPSETVNEGTAKPPRVQASGTQDVHVPSDMLLVTTNRSDAEQGNENKGLEDEKTLNLVSDSANDQNNTPSHFLGSAGDEYAVINKTKRPTIIRPGRPVVPKEPSNSESQIPVKNPPVPSPRMARKDLSDAVIVSQKLHVKTESGSSDATPEFLKLRLKSTTEQSETASKTSLENEKGALRVEKGPPPVLSPKPKPGVLPKPQVLAKPKINRSVDASHDQDVNKEIVTNKSEGSSISDKNENTLDKQDKELKSEPIDDSSVNLKPAAIKRPTIIRPAKSQSVEKLNVSESQNFDMNQENDKTDITRVKQFLDDSNLRPKPRSQPPLPNKRPVSMINIPKSVEQDTDEMPSSRSMNFASGDKPKPIPRPAARARPVSVAVPSTSQDETSSLPPRPQHRPSGHETAKKLGVSVFPQPDKSDTSDDILAPSKPARRPPPPKVSPKAEEKAASDDEIKRSPEGPPKPSRPSVRLPPDKLSPKTESKDSSDDEIKRSPQGPPKPGRPSVRPPPPKVSPKLEPKDSESSEEEFHSVGQEPPRPPPPSIKHSAESEKPQRPSVGPPRKSTVKESTEDSEDDDIIIPVMRPPKPEARPSRPLSTPVKANSPPKSKPSRPGSMAVKKTGAPELPKRPGPGHPLYHHMMKAAHGIALHDFTASQGDELSIEAGEVVILLKSIDVDWIVGQVGEREGMFPRSFVKVKIPLPGESPDEDSDSLSDTEETFYDATEEKPDLIGHGPRCRARFDFDGEGPEDLVFEDGDVIKLLERVGPEWRKGELDGKVGLFPLSFVEIIEDLAEDGATDETSVVVKAMFDYDGQDDELSFQRGDTITVQYKVNDEWLYGECGGRKGQFPVPFVDHMPANLPPFPTQEPSVVKDHLAEASALWEKEEDHSINSKEKPSPHPSSPRHSDEEEDVPYCIAIYDFPGESPEDLSFVTGDRIELLEKLGADWLKGSLHGKTGIFPAAFVEIHKDLIGTASKTSVHEDHHEEKHEAAIYGLALYEFKGEADSELTFEAGTRIKLLERVEGAEDWQWGELDGHRGMFPAAFVEPES